MAFPLIPTDGQKATINNIVYSYSTSTNSWRRDLTNLIDRLTLVGTYESTNTTNGTLVVYGGVGIDKNLNVGGDLQVDGDFSAGGQITLSPAGSDVYIQPSIDGTVVIFPSAYGSIDNMVIGGTTPKIGYFTDLVVESSATSTTPFDGALTVAGGVGIVKDLYVGGTIYGTLSSTSTTGTPWQIIETNYTATNRDRLFISTTVTAVTVTLPATPTFGDFVEFIDYAGSFGVNTATIARNSELIMGIPEDLIVDFAGAANTLIYAGPDEGWRLGALI